MSRPVATVLSLLAAAILVVGCGGGAPSVGPHPSGTAITRAASQPIRPTPKPAENATTMATPPRLPQEGIVEATGRLSCIGANIFQARAVPQPYSPLNAELAPEVLHITSGEVTWRFAWETASHRETGTRWFERNPAEVGSYGEHLTLEFGPSGAAPVVAVRFTFEPDIATRRVGVQFLSLPDAEELKTIETVGSSGSRAWSAVESPQVVAPQPRLLAGRLGFEIEGITLEEGWALRGLRAGSHVLTYPDAGFQECEGRLTSARVLSADRDEFGRLGTSGVASGSREWQIRFD
ncbi:MAG: hypothetical protein ACE5EF_01170 [Dehalococcoidia bacterium]